MDPRTRHAVDVMTRFADRTGVTGVRPPRRYLWTDAFAVCNFLELSRVTGEGRYRELALALVDQVHHVLARHRADDRRSGWISGLGPGEAEAHPTGGGLRIGKSLPERGPAERMDERLEWDRDGQYFHYLTKWMHALDQVARETRQPVFNRWARELAAVAHRAFVHATPGGRRMYWKMSVDLSRPQVASMGQHDALDGFITCVQLDATARALRPQAPEPSLAEAAADFAAMALAQHLATTDPLGLGGLLADADRVAQLMRRGAWSGDDEMLEGLLRTAAVGLVDYLAQQDRSVSADRRLAFRELGLAIGLAAVERMEREALRAPERFPGGAGARAGLGRCYRYASLRGDVESFWLQPEHRQGPTWLDHEDINDVMLASSLLPDGFLALTVPD
jgi:hypothetical protein